MREAGAKDIEDGVVVGTNAGIGEGTLAGHQKITMPEKVSVALTSVEGLGGAIIGLINLWMRRTRI